MKVYVAGSTKEIERVRDMQKSVRDKGWDIILDWTKWIEGETGIEGPLERGSEIAIREISACQNADLTILLCPIVSSGLGCWIEVGAALASGNEVWIIEPRKDSVFWNHPAVTYFYDMIEVYKTMLELP
jgi:hypothetical protein